jgi:hypothetical protein
MITLITLIKLNEQSDAVANLHAAIQALGFSVAADELRDHRAGDSTLKLVRAFQQQSKISFDEKLLVDQPTAAAMNKQLSERGLLSPKSAGDDAKKPPADPPAKLFVIQGQIRQKDGKPAVGLTVRALHRAGGVETTLGESVTEQSGAYRITYPEEVFRKLSGERGGLDVILAVFDPPHGMHQESSAIRITRPIETIDNEVSWLPWKQPEPLPPPKLFRVEGQVRWFNGRQAANLMVRAFDRDLRREEELGQALTDRAGHYQIDYSSVQFRRAEKESADLIVRAFGAESLSVSSSIIFNASSLETVDMILGNKESRGLSEYEQLTSEITPVLNGLSLAALEEDQENQDVTFLSGETGIDREKVSQYIVATKLSQRSKLPPEFWYAGLRGGAFSSPLLAAPINSLAQNAEEIIGEIYATPRATLARALQVALDENIINEGLGSRVEKWLTEFNDFALRELSSSDGKTQSEIKPLLKLSGLRDSKQPKFLRHYLDSGGKRNQILKRLREDQEFDEKEVRSIERTLILNDLTFGHTPLLEAIVPRAGESGVRGLAKEGRDFWEKLLLQPSAAGKVDPPEFIAGDSPEEKAKNYATLITGRFHEEFPTAAFTGGIERAIRNKEKTALKHGELMVGFLNNHPEFELHRTAIEPFIKEKAGPDIINAPNKESFVQELKAAQRIFKLAPDYEATNTLLRDGIHSAQQIYRLSETQFVRKYAGQPGFSEKSARAAYQRSANTQAAVVGLVGELRAADNAKDVFALASDSISLTEFPNLENLFGRADVCECEQCRSVYSPAAYFADVLMFLEHRDSTTALVSVKDVLFERRPDIGYLELSCENSNTPLPYVDVACEVLEDRVAPWHLFNLPLTLLPSMVAGLAGAAVKSAFAAATPSVVLSNEATISEHIDNYRVVRDSLQTYKVMETATVLSVSVLRQTHGTAEELAANPEYVNEAAYVVLRTERYPSSLPFDLFTEEVRAYLDKVKIKRADLMEVFHGNAATTIDIAAEYFGISQGEQSVILDADATNQFVFWGEPNNAAAITQASNVEVFLQKTGLEYNDLLMLLSLKFINPVGSIGIVHLDASCDTTQKRIQVLDAPALDRIHRFLRLWRKLGWKMWEVDLVINQVKLGNGLLDRPNFIDRLKPLGELKAKFPKLTIEQLCSFFGDLNIESKFTESYKNPEPSLYEQIFLNKRLMNPIDPKFGIAAVNVATSTETLDLNLPLVLGALRVKEADLTIFRGLLQPANGPAYINDKLTLKNLSFLYRHVQLARQLKFKATEWQSLLYLAQVDPFLTSQATIDFVELVERVRTSGLSIDEVNYILAADLAAKSAEKEKNVTSFLLKMRSALQQIAQQNDPDNVPTDEEGLLTVLTSQLQNLGWDSVSIGNLLAAFNDFEATAKITTLPDNFSFPAAVQTAVPNIRYDDTTQLMGFTRVMTTAERNILLNDPSLPALVIANVDYQNIINDFFTKSNDFQELSRLLLKLYQPDFVEPLVSLPAALQFPKELATRISYDTGKLQLRFRGIMSAQEKSALDLLAPTDAPYLIAVLNLFNKPRTGVFTADELWLADADILRPLHDTDPLTLDPDNKPANLTTAVTRMLGYLRRTNSNALVVQSFSDSLGITPAIASNLLTFKLFGLHPLLEDFTAPSFVTPNSAISYATHQDYYDAYYWLHRVALVIKRLVVSLTDLEWLIRFRGRTDVLDFATLPLVFDPTIPAVASLAQLLNMVDFMQLSHRYSDEQLTLLEIVERVITDATYDNVKFSADVELLTEWGAADVKFLTDPANLDIAYPADYAKVVNWTRLAQAFAMLNQLNGAAESVVKFAAAIINAAESQSVKQMLRSKYEIEQWLDISKTIQDQLRERKRDSLVAYLLKQPMPADAPTNKWENTNDLYAYYLIDVEMCSCQLTSRLVQASAAAQLFVQRCFMGLERKVRVSAEEDDAWDQWVWMKNYRVWEANRKVFLYPENWIEPELRLDKSPFFQDLENELLQNEIDRDNVETAFLNYIEKLDEVAQLEIAGTCYQEDNNTLHVFARTPSNEPHLYYYRQWVDDRYWTPWSKVDCDIKGDHLVPIIMNQRLYLLWPEFREEPLEAPDTIDVPNQGESVTLDKPRKKTIMQLAISEYRNKKWSGKKVSTDSVETSPYQTQTLDKSPLMFLPLDFTDFPNGKFLVFFFNTMTSQQQMFELLGCKGYPEKVANPGRFFPWLTRFNRDRLKFLKNAENSDGNPLMPTANLVMLSQILDRTPDLFKITYPHYLSYFDKLLFALGLLSTPTPLAATFERGQYLTLGTFFNWFYADKSRTFFVTPELTGGEGKVLFYEGLVEFFKDIIQLFVTRRFPELIRRLIGFFEARYGFHLLFRNFYHPFTCLFAKQLYNEGIDGLMSRKTQFSNTPLDFRGIYGPTPVVDPDYPQEVVDFSPSGSYSQYNWELFFHAPLMIAMRLSKNQRFEEAMKWFHYIFDPTGSHDIDPITALPATAPQKYWITKRFYQTTSQEYIDQRIDNIMRMLADDPANPTDPAVLQELENQVADWRANPFDPHLIAQFRTVAYQKTTVMKYIDNLVAWGDQLFRQDTMESVNEAAQLYVLAAEILGPRPRKVPPARKPAVESFNELEGRLDAFSNAIVNFENLIPVLSGDPPPGPTPPPLPAMLFFCIPSNDKLLGYWDTVADRLYKIRHCLNIEGVFRQLSLFAPPIDPAALVRAVAAGVDIASALNDLSAPLPHYRFTVMLQKANEVTNDVKALGTALLSALEKKDAEALSLLRQSQEMKMLEAVTAVKQQQIDDAKLALDGLKKTREVIQTRRDYYQKIEKISAAETLQQSKLELALIWQQIAQGINIGASIAHIIPSFEIGVSGFGGSPKAGVNIGGPNIGNSLQATAGGFTFLSNLESYNANKAATNAGHARRWDDWKLQEALANKELEQSDKQIASAELKIKIAENELKNHELQRENSKAIDTFMRGKYTNQELYQWMIGQISQVYFQSYQLAYDLAKRAEKCFQYELGVENTSYIKFGYWDSLKKGLLSGERLQYDLRALDAAHIQQNRREFELTKHVSLASLDPLALLQLKENGWCFFDTPEELFDLDYQGHYFRRIKTVSLSIPCVAGPHTTVNATLRLVKNSVRINTQPGSQYEHENEVGVPIEDPRFRESLVNIKSIATSNGQTDSGMFDVNFRDDRYLPFEGAGAIGTWKLELTASKELRQFDYDSISDVVMHLRYTAREDAGAFKNSAVSYLSSVIAAVSEQFPLKRLFNLKHEFPTEWYAFFNPAGTAPNKQLVLRLKNEHFPFMAVEKTIQIEKISLFVKSTSTLDFAVRFEPPLDVPVSPALPGDNDIALTSPGSFGELYWGASPAGLGINLDETIPWVMQMKKGTGAFNALLEADVEEMFMVVDYTLT